MFLLTLIFINYINAEDLASITKIKVNGNDIDLNNAKLDFNLTAGNPVQIEVYFTANKDADDVINKLKSIKILSVDDSLLNKNLNFYTELSKKLDLSIYEELMVVKTGPDITKFLIKQSGNTISELLVVKGGPGGNSLISIKGELNLKNISDMSKKNF